MERSEKRTDLDQGAVQVRLYQLAQQHLARYQSDRVYAMAREDEASVYQKNTLFHFKRQA